MVRTISVLTAFLLVPVLLVWAGPSHAAPHIVVEMRSGKVISQKQAFDRWYPASLTKLMTAYTVFHEIAKGTISAQSPVLVTEEALAQPPSKMGYPVGTVLNIDTALKLIMVKSANDISVALAQATSGSEEAFVAAMNAHAARLGMADTRFTNPHGLHDPGQFTSARDMAVLARAIGSEFREYASYFSIPAVRSGKRILRNHNPLLQRFEGTTGMKTGFICAAGLNIVATVKRRNRELVAVVLGGPTGQERNVRAARLLTKAFKTSPLFLRNKIDTMKRPLTARLEPVDMRPVVCKPSRERKAERSTEQWKAWKADLNVQEEELLAPKGHNTEVIRIALGNATGPDPYGLVSIKDPDNLTAYGPVAAAAGPDWPTIFGSETIKVPLPVMRPHPQ